MAAVAPPAPSRVEAASHEPGPAPRIVVPPVRIVRVTEAPAARPAAPAHRPAEPVVPPKPAASPKAVGPSAVSAQPKAKAVPPAPVGRPAVPPPPAVAADAAAPGEAAAKEPAHVELRRLTEPPMGLGGARDTTLTERIRELKAQRFDHARTRFPLTGKHVRVACESCHVKSLEGTPRDCVACHREDDIHRGRRPDCARCHTTNRWSEIVRRR